MYDMIGGEGLYLVRPDWEVGGGGVSMVYCQGTVLYLMGVGGGRGPNIYCRDTELSVT